MAKKEDPDTKIKRFFKQSWNIIWKDDSFKGWVISLIFIFVVIKLIIFPFLNFATGTTLPLAIVESCSMYHSGNIFGNFDTWWERHDTKYDSFDINNEKFESFDFKRGFSKGDILFIVKKKPGDLKIGDIIIFEAGQKNPVIHRIVGIKQENGEYIFSTIGDNNNGQLSIEKEIKSEQLVGKAVFRLTPFVGWAKLIFYEHLRPQSERGFCEEN